ncbi:MAG TPA: hypothetical protein VHO70_15530 [Chitinispirillaceae bacterium]|nr:hypothetical protein [Chitinispirillaceae bacterium]
MIDFPGKNPFLLIAIVLLCLLSVISGFAVLKWYLHFSMRKKMVRRVRRAATGEKNAQKYLREHGYAILDEQAHIERKIEVDGSDLPFTLRADFIVKKNGRRAVVDAKSGSEAADPANPETRRRMFEYGCYYDVDDIYIYDDIRKCLKKITFTDAVNRKASRVPFLLGVLAGGLGCCGIFLLMLKMV